MAADKTELNHAALREFLRSPTVMAELKRRGDAVAKAAGDGHSVEEYVGKNRDRVTVATETPAAMVAEARDHTLLAALDAGRDSGSAATATATAGARAGVDKFEYISATGQRSMRTQKEIDRFTRSREK